MPVDGCRIQRPAKRRAGGAVDTRGLLAWIPADEKFAPDAGREIFERTMDTIGFDYWPGDIVYLVPLLDGSVLQIRHERRQCPDVCDARSRTSMIKRLPRWWINWPIDDPDKRAADLSRLAQYGPKVNPILEKLAAARPRNRRRESLNWCRGQTLAAMAINGNQLNFKSRLRDVE